MTEQQIAEIRSKLNEKGTIELSLNDYVKDRIRVTDQINKFDRNAAVGKVTKTVANSGNNPQIQRGIYYNIKDVAQFIYDSINTPSKTTVTQNITTLDKSEKEVRGQDERIYSSVETLYKLLLKERNFDIVSSIQVLGEKGTPGEFYILSSAIPQIINKLHASLEIGTNEYYTLIHFEEEKQEKVTTDLKVTITRVKNKKEKERKKETDRVSSIPNYATFDEYQNTIANTWENSISNINLNPMTQVSNMSIQEEPELINDDEYESKQQKYMEAALRAAEATSNYVKTKSEDVKEIYHNVKENVKRIIAKNPEKAKKFAQNTIFTIAVIATLITGAAKISKGINRESQPETPPQQTAIADLSPYAESAEELIVLDPEEEIKEITLDDLKDNICLGENYYLEKGTPISSVFNEAPTGTVSNDTYIIDRIVLYDKIDQNKNILIDTVTKNPETGEIEFSEFYDKSISEIADQNGLSNYGVSIHIAEKGHPCDSEYAKGWVLESNIKESFKELADKLQNELNKTGGKQL